MGGGAPIEDLEQLSVEDLFQLLESNRKPVVTEVQRLIHEQLTESKDSGWLITGLYEYYNSTQSVNGLKLLLNIKEPLDGVLCERIYDGLKSTDSQARLRAVNMLGFIARKQPTWMHKLTSTAAFRELLKLLRHEQADLVLLVTGLLVLLTLLPALPAKVSPYLSELFEVFGRLAGLLNARDKVEGLRDTSLSVSADEAAGGGDADAALHQLKDQHLHVALYAYFHRLYGMFPCNFLIWLRQQYSESGRENSVFSNIVGPLLNTVRMHPLLVTHTKEHEKTSARWKGLGEVHDVLAECSRYSLDIQESGYSEEPSTSPLCDIPFAAGSALSSNLDTSWTPGKFLGVGSAGPAEQVSSSTTVSDKKRQKSGSQLAALRCIESPPEAAIEATPENTPYTTPVKLHDDWSRVTRMPPSSNVIRNLMKSPGPSSRQHPLSPFKDRDAPLSPSKDKETSPFRFSEDEDETNLSDVEKLRKRDSLGLGNVESLLASKIKSLALDQSGAKEVKVESGEMAATEAGEQQEDLEDDKEVSSLTHGAEARTLDTRHITPYIFPGSTGTSTPLTPMTPCSRAQSRISHGSVTPFQGLEQSEGKGVVRLMSPSTQHANDDTSAQAGACAAAVRGEGLSVSATDSPTPFTSINKAKPSRQEEALAVDNFVQCARKRVRYITLCEPHDDNDTDEEDVSETVLRRSSSCPHLATEIGSQSPAKGSETKAARSPMKQHQPDEEKTKTRMSSGTQTETGSASLPWQHLFPVPLQTFKAGPERPEMVVHPYSLLDQHIKAALNTANKASDPSIPGTGSVGLLRDEIALLHSHLLFERQRREVLGARNRRMLGKTKNLRDLEEQNLALTDQLQMAQSEIATLHNQLGSLRAEKHAAETQWSSSSRQQEEKCLALQAELENTKTTINDLEARLAVSLSREAESKAEAEISKVDLFQAQAKLEKYKGKENRWTATEKQMEENKKQILLQAQLINNYKESLDSRPTKTSQPQLSLITEAAKSEVAGMRAQLANKTTELGLANATVADLEVTVETLNKNLSTQILYLEQMQQEYKTNLQVMEERYAGMRKINSHLEISLMEMQERFESLKMSRRGRKVASPSSDSLDLREANLLHTSNTSSIHGSIGSDPGEHIRRALEAPNPSNITREIEKQVSSPEIGSAQSANPHMETRSPASSNGHS